jgi:hypothetical protein
MIYCGFTERYDMQKIEVATEADACLPSTGPCDSALAQIEARCC